MALTGCQRRGAFLSNHWTWPSRRSPGFVAWCFLGLGLLWLVAYFATAGAVQGMVYLLWALAAVGAVVVGLRRYQPSPRLPWLLLAGGLVLSSVADAIWWFQEHVRGIPVPFPSPADAFYLTAYALIAAALLRLAHGRTRGGDRSALLDAAVVAVAAVVLAWSLLIQPVAADSTLPQWGRLIAVAYPLASVINLAVLARLLLALSRFSTAHLLLACGLAAGLVADILYARLLLADTYRSGHPLDAGWLVMYAAFGAAALHPSMRDVPEPAVSDWGSTSRRRWLFLAAVALVPPLTFVVETILHEPADLLVFLPASAAMLLLLGFRLRDQEAAVKEAAVIVAAIAGALVVSIRFEVAERLSHLPEESLLGQWEFDALFVVLPLLAGGLAVFAWRRWQEARREVAERRRTEAALREAKEAAEVANRLKSTFLSTMSHELRTPLTAVMGYAHLLLDDRAGGLTDQQAADVEQISRAATHLTALIDDVLDLSKIEAGQLELRLEPVPVAPLLDEVRQLMLPQAEAHGLSLTVTPPPDLPPMLADRRRVRQILLNLVGNAVKFTERGRVELSARERPGAIEVAVADTGIGVAPAALPHIFDAFRQEDGQANRRFGGTGLGLTIARRLARAQGGDVRVSSEPGRGSTFTLSLPPAPGLATLPPPAPPLEPGASSVAS